MSKHTPGPWLAIGDTLKTSINAGFKHIAMVNYSKCGSLGDVYGDEHKANVRLITAAPDLLAACQKYLAAERQLDHARGSGIPHTALSEASRAARAAITKALGKVE